MQTITLGGGCFWCTEAAFQMIRGVTKVTPGYAGGSTTNPAYAAVCTGTTGHAEVVQVEFDPAVIQLKDVLDIFWAVHDPTTLDRQGDDWGTQYRSVILYMDKAQLPVIKESVARTQKLWTQPIVTEVKPLERFYEAEPEHHDYFKAHPEKAYCQIVINPKLHKLREKYSRLFVS